MLGLHRPRINVAEYRVNPSPRARPIVSFFLVGGPGNALGLALGFPQPHSALITVADTANRIDRLRRLHDACANLVPFGIELHRASHVGRGGRWPSLRVDFGTASSQIR